MSSLPFRIARILQVTEQTNSGAAFYKTYSYAGAVAVHTGTDKFYPFDTATNVEIEAYVGTAPVGANLIAQIKKDGVAVDTVTIAAGTTSGLTTSTTSYTQGEALTVDITQIGSTTAGSDLKINFKFTKA